MQPPPFQLVVFSDNTPWKQHPARNMRVSPPPSWRPGGAETARLFATGSIVGPLVDSLHNQCLLTYQVAPIVIDNPLTTTSAAVAAGDHLFASSWLVPPLLGIAYVVLGGVLPRLAQGGIDRVAQVLLDGPKSYDTRKRTRTSSGLAVISSLSDQLTPRENAIVAVLSTAALIKLSSVLELSATPFAKEILLSLAILQWVLLDGSWASFFVASLAAFGGPLSELPFVGHHVWTYLPMASDYFPLHDMTTNNAVLTFLLGDDYLSLGLASITAPCYFAVTMDAIACGRWFALRNADANDVIQD